MTEKQNPKTYRPMPRLFRVTQVFAFLATLFLLVTHTAKWNVVQVDVMSLALLGLLIVIPLADLVRKIKLGEFEAEIGSDEIAKVQAKAAVELSPTPQTVLGSAEQHVRELIQEDPRLALAKVRIELEEALKRLSSSVFEAGENSRQISLGRMVDNLLRRDVLTTSVAGALRDVISLANRAIHGERVEPADAEQLAVLGIRLVREIRQLYLERMLRPKESLIISPEEVKEFRSARYKVTTVVPLVENPTRKTYVFDQDALDSFLEGYEKYAEFIVAIERI